MLTATFEYSGMIDYWGGNGRRWDDNAVCLFAFYGPHTTLRNIIDQLVDDFQSGGDCDSLPESVSAADVRLALLTALTDQGRVDYDSDALSEWAMEYAAANDDIYVGPTDEDESPVVIVLIEYTPDTFVAETDESKAFERMFDQSV